MAITKKVPINSPDWPLVRFFLTDADERKIATSVLVNYGYITVDGSTVTAEGWQISEISERPAEAKYVRYRGYLTGDAAIVFAAGSRVISGQTAPAGRVRTEMIVPIPDGTTRILVSYYAPSGNDLSVSVMNIQDVDITEDVTNWDEVDLNLNREQTSGVMYEVTMPARFTGETAGLLRDLVATEGLYARRMLEVWKRHDRDVELYTRTFALPLDFETYKENAGANSDQYPYYVEMNCAQGMLSDYVNSGGSTSWDILVSDVAEGKQWGYNRMVLQNTGTYSLPEENTDSSIGIARRKTLYVYLNGAEQVMGSTEHYFKTQGRTTDPTNDYFFEAAGDVTVRLKARFGTYCDGYFGVDYALGVAYKPNDASQVVVYLSKFDSSNNETILASFRPSSGTEFDEYWVSDPIVDIEGGTETRYFSFAHTLSAEIDSEYALTDGDRLVMYWAFEAPSNVRVFAVQKLELTVVPYDNDATQDNYFTLGYEAAALEPVLIDVIDPLTLGQKLIDTITDTSGIYTMAIEWDESESYLTRLVAAESIRNFDTPYLHASLKDFMEWLRAFGYEYEIDGNTMTFKRRGVFYDRSITAMEVKQSECSGLLIATNASHAYTGVRIGYDEQDYESVNGLLEPNNGAFEYATGYNAFEENTLELVSPYRADSLGVEFLCWKRGESTTDSSSDKDIFVVALIDNGTNYVEYTGTAFADTGTSVTPFNEPFSQYHLVERNMSLIGVNTKQLRFSSTEGSRTVDTTTVDYYSDITATEKLFDPVRCQFDTGYLRPLPASNMRNGLVYFNYGGVTRKGFIREIMKNEAAEKSTTWTLDLVFD